MKGRRVGGGGKLWSHAKRGAGWSVRAIVEEHGAGFYGSGSRAAEDGNESAIFVPVRCSGTRTSTNRCCFDRGQAGTAGGGTEKYARGGAGDWKSPGARWGERIDESGGTEVYGRAGGTERPVGTREHGAAKLYSAGE